ncbi:MAG: MFS transporter [Spirochaetaceae bacterium]|jgi:UMF1 family MFS transporter|nr:MFS transporter [Spirochaetaceae bacterium]
MAEKQRFTKAEKSWILYDWANSVYATIMLAAIYPIYFVGTMRSQGGEGDFWWGIGSSLSMLVLTLSAPIVGAIADYRGWKKKLFAGFLVIGLAFTLFCAFTDFWPLMLLGFILSRIGFNGSCLVYDSFLTDITTSDRMDRVSNYGFAFGYIGGSTIPFVFSIALMQLFPRFGLSTSLAVKASLVITVVWWGLFSIPFLKTAAQVHCIEKPQTAIVKETFLAIGRTAKKIVSYKGVFFFIIAYFFYIDGVDTVISMSTAYGETLGLGTVSMILALLLTQLIAFPCSMLFSYLSKRFSSLKMILAAVCLYLVICIVGFIMGFGLEQDWFGIPTATTLFWILASLVGTVQGGIQGTSRSHFAKIIPPENSGEFFGFYDIFGKFAAILGPAMYSLTKSLTGSSAMSILSLTVLFLVALVIFALGWKHMKAVGPEHA